MKRCVMAVLLASAVVFLGHASQVQAADKRVKVFIARYPHNLAAHCCPVIS